jgi:hypothetical protein
MVCAVVAVAPRVDRAADRMKFQLAQAKPPTAQCDTSRHTIARQMIDCRTNSVAVRTCACVCCYLFIYFPFLFDFWFLFLFISLFYFFLFSAWCVSCSSRNKLIESKTTSLSRTKS